MRRRARPNRPRSFRLRLPRHNGNANSKLPSVASPDASRNRRELAELQRELLRADDGVRCLHRVRKRATVTGAFIAGLQPERVSRYVVDGFCALARSMGNGGVLGYDEQWTR